MDEVLAILFLFCFSLRRVWVPSAHTKEKESTWRKEKYQGRVYKIKLVRNLLVSYLSHHLLCNKALKT